MTRKICIVTGTRAEYGLLRWVMEGIKADPDLALQVIATGMHLSPEFGLTYREIEADGFVIDRKVEMLMSSDTPVGIAKSTGLGMIGFADAFAELAPDIVVVLGDRFEILAAATAAMIARIPLAHLHGGERTEGVIDEAIRHAVTKMAQLHFVAAEPYRRRVIQLGESPARVFLVGGLGVDAISRVELLDRAALEADLGFTFRGRNLLIAFHPVMLEDRTVTHQFNELLSALETLEGVGMIFTLPNADAGGREIIRAIERFVSAHPLARAYTSLGQRRFLSCLAECDGIVGNSSSGLLEAPSLGAGTVNIGDRQLGRLQAASVISCEAQREDIAAALDQMLSPAFKMGLASVVNPYGEGGASEKIVATLRAFPLEQVLNKQFHDLNPNSHICDPMGL